MERHLVYVRACADGLHQEANRFEQENTAIDVHSPDDTLETDTLPPSQSQPTLPPPSRSAGELPILHGDAVFVVSQAMDALVGAVVQIEKISMALGRLADGQKEPTT
jgi:hypothetical protein